MSSSRSDHEPETYANAPVEMLTCNSIIKSLLSKMASLIGRVEDLVVENGEVESKTKTDWVCRCEIGLSNLSSVLVGLKRFVGRCATLVANGELGEVSMVIALPTSQRIKKCLEKGRAKNLHFVIEHF